MTHEKLLELLIFTCQRRIIHHKIIGWLEKISSSYFGGNFCLYVLLLLIVPSNRLQFLQKKKKRKEKSNRLQ
jgi:hypothetical protein